MVACVTLVESWSGGSSQVRCAAETRVSVMKWHPSLGFFDEGFDLAGPLLLEQAVRTFGQAKTLHPVVYRSKVFADLEDEKIWTRAWVCIGSHCRIPAPGDLLPYTVGNHGVHIQRDHRDQLRGRFNKAQHGGCRSIPQQCQTGKKTKCSYGSCGYSRDRDVIHASELEDDSAAMGQYIGFNPAKLTPIAVETAGPFAFVNLDTNTSKASSEFDQIKAGIGTWIDVETQYVGRRSLDVPCNWKVIGTALLQKLGINRIDTCATTMTGTEATWPETLRLRGDLSSDRAPAGGVSSFEFWWVFPNLLLARFPDYVLGWIIQPTSQTDCFVQVECFVEAKRETLSKDDHGILDSWAVFTQGMAKIAEQNQAPLVSTAIPASPEGAPVEQLPIEQSYGAYWFQRCLARRIQTTHNYFWNDSYTNPRAAVSASTPGAA
jgi:hypothetical protein